MAQWVGDRRLVVDRVVAIGRCVAQRIDDAEPDDLVQFLPQRTYAEQPASGLGSRPREIPRGNCLDISPALCYTYDNLTIELAASSSLAA